jgi:hypothetical protein
LRSRFGRPNLERQQRLIGCRQFGISFIEMLIDAGAQVCETDSDFPTGNERVDDLLRRHGMKPRENHDPA